MENLDLLSVALGLAVLSGLNLYLTVFAAGLAIRLHWVVLGTDYQQLAFLGGTWILTLAGIMMLIEFVADKIPWVDSIWDAFHTIIRPLGGALLATQALGHMSPVYVVTVGLLAGTMSFAAHGAKAGTRLIANGSPEPFSNIGLSLAEDAAVLGGLVLLHLNPVVALLFFLLFLAFIIYFAPRLFRAVRARLWLSYRKLTLPVSNQLNERLSNALSALSSEQFARINLLNETISWAVPCISKKSKQLASNIFGNLVATTEEPTKLYFVSASRWSSIGETLELSEHTVELNHNFLCEELRLLDSNGRVRHAFLFDRARSGMVDLMADSIRRRLAPVASANEPLFLEE